MNKMAVAPAAPTAAANPLDSLQAMVNLVLVQTGHIFHDPDKQAPKNLLHTQHKINEAVNEAQRNIHATLDKAETELIAAKAVLNKELQALREKRLRLAGAAVVVKDEDGDFTMIDHSDAAGASSDVKPKIKDEILKTALSTLRASLPAASATIPDTEPQATSFLADLTTSPSALNNGADGGDFLGDLSGFPDSGADGLDFENDFLNLDFVPTDHVGGNGELDGVTGGGSSDQDLFNALNSLSGGAADGGFDLLHDVPTGQAGQHTGDGMGGAADTDIDDLMFNFGDGDLNLGADNMVTDLDKEFANVGGRNTNFDDDDLFGDNS